MNHPVEALGGPESIPLAPGRIPVAGHLAAVIRGPLEFLVGLRSSGEVVRVDLGRRPVYVLTSPALHRQALTTDAQAFQRGLVYERARALFGDGLATSDGALHRRQRRLVQPMFRRTRIDAATTMMAATAEQLAGSWRPGQIVAVGRAMNELTRAMIVSALTSRPVGRDAAIELERLTPVVMRGIALRMLTPAKLSHRFDAASRRLRSVVAELIASYRADPHRTGVTGTDEPPDLLSLLLTTADPETGEPMSDRLVCDEVISLLMAGTETPGSTLAWIFHELARHPSVEQQLHEEVDRVTEPAKHLGQLPYTSRVVTEALRLHPTLLFTLRTTETVTLGRYRLPAGTEVAYSPYALHRDPQLYLDPERFDPDRWADRSPEAFAPFNVGVHRCIGEHFARAAMTITVATIARRWRLRHAGSAPVGTVPAIVPRPRALSMRVEARAAATSSACRPAGW